MPAAPSRFRAFAKWTSRATGRPVTFVLAVLVVAVWAVTGPLFHWSDTWQLVINTGTTVVTFLMVFLIQNTQNRDAEAVQVKLDELIRATKGAHNRLLDLEELEQEDLEAIHRDYEALARQARERGRDDTDQPEVENGPTGDGQESRVTDEE
ncbi:MAG TPA: low affinity iron permease family protein [Gemmatimonadales bacterium]|nr:low affinity iron permease family protein [Gemmatimonadales bacterium]